MRIVSPLKCLASLAWCLAAFFQVLPCAAQPVISDIPDQSFSYLVPAVSVPFTVSDAITPANQLILGKLSSNQALVPNANLVLSGSGSNRFLTIVPTGGATGFTVITVTAMNSAYSVAAKSFLFELTNALPSLPVIADVAVLPNRSSETIPFTISDLESPPSALTLTATSLNTAVVPDAGIVLGGSGTNRTIMVTPRTNVLGSALVQLTLTDEKGGSVSNIFRVSVTPFRDLGLGLPGYGSQPGAGWGDYDADGWLDFVVGGNDGNGSISCVTKLYRNLGGTNFALSPASLPGIQQGNLAWGEFNNDNRLDLILAGPPFGGATVLRNNGGDTFSSVFSSEFMYEASCDWADYDNDGKMDFAAGGWNSSVMFSRLFRNTGTGFAQQGISLPGTMYGRLTWGDYNKDGSQDLVLVGYKAFANYACTLFTNNNLGQLTDSGHPFPGGWQAAEWGDYDNDGWLDLLFSRHDVWGSNQVTVIYRNQGDGTLADTGVRLPGVTWGWLGWGDFDNDGFLDVLLTGNSPSAGTNLTRVYRNNGDNTFTDVEAMLPPINNGRALWGDYDNDGRLDILVTGTADGAGGITRIYHNEMPRANAIPAAPASINSLVTTNSVRLSWQPGSDPNQPVASLTYNLRLGTSPGGADVFSPLADATTGRRRVPHRGNADHDLDWPLRGLAPGTYYWSVQAVDHALAGSLFASESSFVITQPPTISAIGSQAFYYNTNSGPLAFTIGDAETPADNLILSATSSATSIVPIQNIVFGGSGTNRSVTITPATNQTGSLTVTLWLTDAEGYVTNTSFNVHIYNSYPTLSSLTNQLVPVGATGSPQLFTIGDFETPAGDLVLSATSSNPALVPVANVVFGGSDSNRTVTVSLDPTQRGSTTIEVLVTDPLGAQAARSFTVTARELMTITNQLPPLLYSTAAWGDYDNDGRLDLVLAGDASTNVITRLYRNLGDGNFEVRDPGLPGIRDGAVTWGDYDNDGWLDLVLAGSTNLSAPGVTAAVFRNNGDGTFTDVQAGLPSWNNPALAWGDYDRDGRLDIAMSGSGSSEYFTRIYRNGGNGRFDDISANLPGMEFGSLAWGDYDRDGWPDLLLSGYYGQASTLVYRNTRNGAFTNINAALPGALRGSANWGDYDNDGWPDIAVCGWTGSAVLGRIYRNNGNNSFTLAASLPGVQDGGNAWLDFDNDGSLDLLMWGFNGTVATTTLYRNGGGNNFTDIGAQLPGFYYGKAAPADYNSDGRLDLCFAGYNGNRFSALLQNITPQTNSAPAAPAGLSAVVASRSVTLSWTGQGDAQTPVPGLTYNLRVGSVPGAQDVLAPAAATNGLRRLVQFGGAGQTNSVTLQDLPYSGTYYWTVQAIDPAFAGSTFATEEGFTAVFPPGARTLPATGVSNTLATFNGLLSTKGYETAAWFEYGSNAAFGARIDLGVFPTNAVNQPLAASIADLTADITNYYRLVASNEVGVTYGNTVAFLSGMPPLLLAPTATNISSFGASLRVSTNPNRSPTGVWFEYGTNTDYGTSTTVNTYPASTTLYTWLRSLTGLAPGTLYHFRAVATNEFGTTIGSDATFTTTAEPRIASAAATAITNTGATLLASVVPNGYETTAWFEYGASTNYGNYTPLVNLGAGLVPKNLLATITNLPSGSSNFFRVVAVNSSGSTNLARSFVTSNAFYRVSPNLFNVPYLANSSVAWVDYNNDGALDLALSGNFSVNATPQFRLFRNNRGAGGPIGAFQEQTQSPPLVGTRNGSMSWGDYNNDGLLDVLLTGYTNSSGSSGPSARLYRNNGNNTFSNVPAVFPAVGYSASAWGDFNNDGRPDLFLMGASNTTASVALSRIYLNDGDGSFRPLTNAIPPLMYGAVALADYDNDGRLDILVSGMTNSSAYNPVTRLYRNNGNNSFSSVLTNLPGVRDGSLAWGDYDQDGRLDILLTGNTNYSTISYSTYNLCKVFRNNPDGTFTDAVTLQGVNRGGAVWGDYDNDGRLDILVQGDRSSASFTLYHSGIYRNAGGSFELLNTGLPLAYAGSVAWADYDNDGRLDFLFTGITNPGQSGACLVFRNFLPPTNTAPTSPTGLESLVLGRQATLRWQIGADGQTDAAGLTYNLRIGTAPGGQDVVGSDSAPTNGFRRLALSGNVGQNRLWTFTNLLASGTFHWSVQSVDNTFAGSAFAPEQVLVFPGAPSVTLSNVGGFTTNSATLTGYVDANTHATAVWAEWGLTTNYGGTGTLTNIPSNGIYAMARSTFTGLEPLTLYHCRLAASNSAGVAYTSDQTFIQPGLPLISGQYVTNVGAGQAAVRATVNPQAGSTTVRYEWGMTPAFGNFTGATGIGSGTNGILVNGSLGGLSPATTYYVRAVASNLLGTVLGHEAAFQTVPAPSLTGIVMATNGTISLEAEGTDGLVYDLQASTNLLDWISLGTALPWTNGVLQFTDPTATNFNLRFYRLQSP